MRIIICVVLIIGSLGAYCQYPFTKSFSIDSDNFLNGKAAWGDYNNDGNIDLIQIGTPKNFSKTKLFKNNGNGTFTENKNSGIGNFGLGDVAWGDYNRDGLLDVVIVGREVFDFGVGSEKTGLYKNLGSGRFAEIKTDFPNVGNGSVEWVDFDNDGDLDVLLCGNPAIGSFEFITALFRNDGNDRFTSLEVPFDKVCQSDIAWGDFDNDGDQDLAIAGWDAFNGVSKIYRNEGNGKFSFFQSLEIAMRASIDWGDYNNDGLLDLVVSGFNGSKMSFNVYKNKNNKEFTKINTDSFSSGGEQGTTYWFDYDRDGDLDIISSFTGIGADQRATFKTAIYANFGGDKFELVPNTGLPEDISPISLVDIDKDGDLDVYFLSVFKSQYTCTFFINNSNPPVYQVLLPSMLLVESSPNQNINLKWSNASSQSSYTVTYNVYLRNNGDTIVASNSLRNGSRKILKLGNTQLNSNYSLPKLVPGDYCWSVQCVDKNYFGSSFIPENCFRISELGLIETITPPQIVTGDLNTMQFSPKVFPNPAKDAITIVMENSSSCYSIEIFDVLGKLILLRENLSTESVELNLSYVQTGYYVVKITSPNFKFYNKIVIER